MSAGQAKRYTIEQVKWIPRIETVDDVGATEEQAALVQKVAPNPDGRAYYATLAHDVPALRERTELFNAVMYSHGGLRRADRELATVAASISNGCIYCTSVHARRYTQLTKSTDLINHLFDQGLSAEVGEYERAIIDYAVKLTREPGALTAADLTPLRDAGLSDPEILDVINATAMFAWANRLMQTLGDSEPPAATSA